MFELLATDTATKARLGRLTTAHGVIETPVYMPVGTQASVKAMDPLGNSSSPEPRSSSAIPTISSSVPVSKS